MKFRALAPAALVPALLALFVPAALWAQETKDWLPQTEAPDAVNQALTERVTQFFNYHVGSVNFRAMDLVAEESKEVYFGAGKNVIKGFKVTDIQYASKDFDRAAVRMDVTRDMHMEGQTFEGTSAIVTNWKLEDGKWVWFYDKQNQWVTPMGASDLANPIKMMETFTQEGKLPEGFNTPEAMATQMSAILGQAGLDKKEIRFAVNRAGQDQVAFTNGFPGQINLKLYDVPGLAGLKVTLEKSALQRGENGIVKFEYTPQPGEPLTPGTHEIRLVLEPFAQQYPINLILDPAVK